MTIVAIGPRFARAPVGRWPYVVGWRSVLPGRPSGFKDGKNTVVALHGEVVYLLACGPRGKICSACKIADWATCPPDEAMPRGIDRYNPRGGIGVLQSLYTQDKTPEKKAKYCESEVNARSTGEISERS